MFIAIGLVSVIVSSMIIVENKKMKNILGKV